MLLARNEAKDELNVVDEGGHQVGRVTLPLDPRLFGVERGTVYLERPIPSGVRPPAKVAAAA
jgi:hypothetical protein